MKSYKDWRECKEGEKHSDENLRKDHHGGILPTDMAKAKKVDLITYPPGIEGGNCGNCEYFVLDGDHGWCEHKEVQMHVTKRQCCIYWDRDDIQRPWGDSDATNFAKTFAKDQNKKEKK